MELMFFEFWLRYLVVYIYYSWFNLILQALHSHASIQYKIV